jgi:hypothetical protein
MLVSYYYMREAAISAGVPRSSVYDVTLYLLAGLLLVGLVANLLVRPVPHKWFMLDAEVTSLQAAVSGAPQAPSAASGRSTAGGLSLASSLAWAAVGIPILWGIWVTLAKVAVLFS